MNLLNLFLRKTVRLFLTMFSVTSIVFLILRVIPGDPASVIAGTLGGEGAVPAIRQQLGLDLPLHQQYFEWLRAVGPLGFGSSLISGEPVLSLILNRFPVTLLLALMGMGFAFLVAIPLGVLSAVRRWSVWDHLGMVFSQLGIAVPEFWLSILLLLLFSVNFRIFPLFGGETIFHYVLPALSLGLSRGAVLLKLVRASVIEELNKEYIITARAKGLPEKAVLYRHALRNALITVLTVSGIQLGYMLGGAIIVEQVFALPGVGRLLLTAIFQRDFPVIQGGAVFVAMVFTLVNFTTDILYNLVNPRIRMR